MDYTIRTAIKSDMPQALKLIKELAVFEKEEHEVELTVVDLENDGFGANKKFHCFVADSKDGIVGLALLYPRYSTWKGTVIHLEDLIVNASYRGSGLGTALLNEVVKYGHALGVKRIGWEVLDWNEPAIKFYESKGARVMRDWDVVQLNEAAIKNYLENL